MNFKKTFAILLLVALIAGTFATIPMQPAEAQTAPMTTFPIIDAIPNPVGVDEECLLKTGILQPLASVNYGWTGLTITVVRPDNTTETLGPFTTDSTGSTYTTYIPTQVGTYKLTTHFPEQENPANMYDMERGYMIAAGRVMAASTSEEYEVVVTAEGTSVPYPGHPLPTEYWSRPIDPQLREWFVIAGNWMYRPDNSLALYNEDAPETAHVLWAEELTTGGMMGGLWGDSVPSAAETGDAYEGKFANAVVLNGILYYRIGEYGGVPKTVAVDLHTGERLFVMNGTSISRGQIFYFNSYNYDGTFSYIWDGSWNAYDPFSGEWQWSIRNITSGAAATTYGPSGEILMWYVNYDAGWMALWNSTLVGLQNSAQGTSSYGSWGSQVHGKTFAGNTAKCFSWNVSIPAGLQASRSFFSPILKVYDDRVVSIYFNLTHVRVWGLSTAEGSIGLKLFDVTTPAPSNWNSGTMTLHYVGASNQVEGGVIAVWSKEDRIHHGYSVETGKYLWSTDSEHYSDAYGWGNAEHTWYFAYGNLYSIGVGGILYCYDACTGDTLWTYELDDLYNEPVTGQNWWGWITLIADNKIYVGTCEHSAEQPLPRGAPQACINATDGTEIWRVNGMFRDTRWGGNGVIGDSIIATMDTYDQRVYAIGKGPSALWADASPKSSVEGSSVIIEGRVTDISPGTNTYQLTSRFPNGVPAVADANMSAWMLYVYKQFEKPMDVTGVPVEIYALDSNNNYRFLGTATSDSTGYFSLDWQPDIPGKYTVYATFGGSAAYFGSSDTTSFIVDAAPEATAAPTDKPDSPADLYFLPMSIVIIVLIIVIGAILVLLLLRRRE